MKTLIPLEIFKARHIIIHPVGATAVSPRIEAVLGIPDNDCSIIGRENRATCYLVYNWSKQATLTETLTEALEVYLSPRHSERAMVAITRPPKNCTKVERDPKGQLHRFTCLDGPRYAYLLPSAEWVPYGGDAFGLNGIAWTDCTEQMKDSTNLSK